MFNKKLFEQKLIEKGLKRIFIADKLNLTPYGLSKKINGENEFKASEIYSLIDILGLTSKEKDAIFFARESE